MYAISIRQPWLWGICRGGKDVENRANKKGPSVAMATFNKTDRRILLHASSTWEGDEAHARVRRHSPIDPGTSGSPRSDTAWFGDSGFVATAWFGGVHVAEDCYDPATDRFCSPWADRNAAHLHLRDVQVFHTPVAYRGSLGMFEVTDTHVLAQIQRQAA